MWIHMDKHVYIRLLLVLVILSLMPPILHASTNPAIEVYFMPIDAARAIHRIVELINSAQRYVYLASFLITERNIINALVNASHRGLDVRVVSDSDTMRDYQQILGTLQSNGIGVRLDNREGDYMHDKFIVIDDKIVATGSTNFRDRSFYNNNNDLVIIHSPGLAFDYKAEFLEMYNGIFGGGTPVPKPMVRMDNTYIEAYFSPEDHVASHIIHYISRANHTVLVAAYVFTNNEIAESLASAARRGVSVYVVVEEYSLSSISSMKSLVEYLEEKGVRVYTDVNPYTMHCKFFIVDDKIVITGSYNPSLHAEYRNDENIVIIHSHSVALKYRWYYMNYVLPNGTRLIVRIVDRGGTPVAGAFVTGKDLDTGDAVSGVTNSSGIVELYIPGLRPGHRVRVSASVNGFFGGSGTGTLIVRLGPNNIRVEVERYNYRLLVFITGTVILIGAVFGLEKAIRRIRPRPRSP